MKKLFIAFFIAIFLILVIAITIPFFIDLNKYKGVVVSQIEKAIQRDVEIDKIKLSLLKGIGVNLNNITVSNNPEFKKEPFLKLDELEVKLKFLPLLKKRVEVKKIVLNSPRILLEVNEKGIFNFDDLINPKKVSRQKNNKEKSPLLSVSQETKVSSSANPFLKNLSISQIMINNGKVKFIDDYFISKKTKITTIEDLNLKATNVSLYKPLNLRLSAKIPAAKEQKIDINGKIGPFGERFDAKKIDFNLDIKLKDLDIASLYPYYQNYSPLVIQKGLLNTDTRLSGNINERLMSDGKISLNQLSLKDKKGVLRLNKTVDLHVERKLVMDFKRDLASFDSLSLMLLDNHLNLSGKIEKLSKEPRLDFQLSSKKLILSQIEELYPPIKESIPKGMNIKGPLSLKAEIKGVKTDLTLKGNLNLDDTQLIIKDILNKPEKMDTRLLYDFSFGKDQLIIRNASLNLKDLSLKSSGSVKQFKNPLIDIKIKTNTINLKGFEDIILPRKGKKLSGLVEIDMGLKGQTRDLSKIYLDGKLRLKDIEPLEELMNLFPPAKKGTRMLAMQGKASLDGSLKGSMNDLFADTRLDLDQAGISYAGIIKKPMGTSANLILNGRFAKDSIRVNKLSLRLRDLNIKGSGTIINIKRPRIDLSLSTNEIDFIQLKELIPLLEKQKLSGRLKTDVKIKGDLERMKGMSLQGEVVLSKVGAKFSFIPKEIHDLSGKISMTGNSLDIRGLILGYGSTKISLDARVEDFDSPKIRFSLSSPRLKFDEFFPPSKGKKAEGNMYGDSILPVAKKSEETFLSKIQAKGDIAVKEGSYQNLSFSDLKANLFFGKSALTVKPLTFNIYKGLFSGSALVDLKGNQPQFYVESKLKSIDVGELINSNTSLKDMIKGTLDSDLSLSGMGGDAVTITKSLDGKGKFLVTNGEINMALLRDLLRQLPLQQLSLIQPDFRRLHSCIQDYSKMEKTNFQYLTLPLSIKNGTVYVPRYQILSSDLLDVITDQRGGKINLNTMDVDFQNVMAVLTKKATDNCFGPKAQRYVVNEQGRAVIPFEWRGRIKEGNLPSPRPDVEAILARAMRGGIYDSIERLIDKGKKEPPSQAPTEQPKEPPKTKEQMKDLGKELGRELLKELFK